MAGKSAKEKNDEQYLYVRSTTGDNRVALHEVDPMHPGGSAMVAGNIVVKVGKTAMVMERLRSHLLGKVEAAADKKAADKAAQEKIDANSETPRQSVPDADDVDEETGEVDPNFTPDDESNEPIAPNPLA